MKDLKTKESYKVRSKDIDNFVKSKLIDYDVYGIRGKQFMILFGDLMITVNGRCN